MSTPATLDAKQQAARLKALESALAEINKKEGNGERIVRRMDEAPEPVRSVSTGVLPLDVVLGINGLPEGRIVEIYGPESSGKTTLCYHIMAAAQRAGHQVGFIDAEHAMDPIYAGNIGMDIPNLVVSQPDYGEQALRIAQIMIESGVFKVIVIDSVAALIPKAELEGQIGDSSVGLQARMMSQAMRKLVGAANRNKCTLVFVNQIREKIGVMFGSPETQPGGRALKFAASVRLDIRRIETLKEGTEAVGTRVRVKVVKNKVAAPFTQTEFDNLFGFGFDPASALYDLAIEEDVEEAVKVAGLTPIMHKSGAQHTFYNGEKLGSKAKAKAYLRENPEVAEQLDKVIRAVKSGAGIDSIEGLTVPAAGVGELAAA